MRWHPCRCHIGDMQVVKYSNFSHTCVRKLEKKSWGQSCKRCERHGGCGKCEWSSHMCEHTLRIKRGFSKVLRVNKGGLSSW